MFVRTHTDHHASWIKGTSTGGRSVRTSANLTQNMRQWAANPERGLTLRPRVEGGNRARGKGSGHNHDQPAARTSTRLHGADELLCQTARLALSTARQARMLTAIVSRTITMPDGTKISAALLQITRQDLMPSEDQPAYMWGLLMLALADLHQEGLPADSYQCILDHAEHSTTIATVREHILDCQIYRVWSGDATNIRVAVANELQGVLLAAIRILVHLGGRLRYGPPPRGPLERAVSSALQAHADSAAQHGHAV